ncbi:MAG TPA: hypothetical protein VFE84_14150, partial [Patescibacteria group bacterium]|nr:hypothetical protein [Patescibacteria group bacterium]
GTWALVETADRGGALVYRHGVAVTPANAGADAARAPASTAKSAPSAPPAQVPARPAAPASPVIRGADGTLVWMPGPDDSAQLGAILTNAVGSDPAVVTAEAIPPSSGAPAGPGINLRVSGRSMLLLSGTYGDVQLEAVLDLTGFQGAAALAHHASALDDAGIFQITTQGIASLVHLRSKRDRQLDQAETRLPPQPMKLVLSSAGMHIKGMLNGKVLVHAHEAPSPDGSVGLLLDGHGIVRLISLQVEPLRHAGKAR